MDSQPDFRELSVRLEAYGLRVFAEFGLRGRDATVSGVGLSLEDFVWNVLAQYAEGKLRYQAERGELFSLLARTLRNDIIDALRKAAHAREEARSPLARENTSEDGPPTLDELPAPTSGVDAVLNEESYRARILAMVADEPELADVVRAVFDLGVTTPREIAAALGISVAELQNRKKRLRRRLNEYYAVEVSRHGRTPEAIVGSFAGRSSGDGDRRSRGVAQERGHRPERA